MHKYVCQPTNPADGDAVKIAKLEDAIKYCSVAYTLGIRAVVLDMQTKQIVHRNYPIYTGVRNPWG